MSSYMSFRTVQDQLEVRGLTLRKVGDEYRVNFIGGTEATAYYTPDLDDAYETGRAMFRESLKAR